MLSKRGTQLLVIEGYKFRFHKYLVNDVERWVCTQKLCIAFLKRSGGETVASDLHHNHPRDSLNSLTRQKVANACKRKAIEDIFERPSKIIRRKVTAGDLEVLNEEDRVQIRKSIHTARAKERPPLPKTLQELHAILNEYELKTKLYEPFILVNDDVGNIVMFSTERNLKFLASCDTLLMDGTFYSAPLLFAQAVILHGRKNNRHVPLVYFLLTCKSTETYTLALTKLRTFLPATYSPDVVYVD